MSNTFGNVFKITTWGESHGNSLGVVVDGCPPGIEISEELIQKELDRRRPGQSDVATPRKESDKVHVRSGLLNNVTTGMPIALEIFNYDADSSKYEDIKHKWRPGHADFTFDQKYGLRDYRGSGRSSGRETAARVAGGAVAKQILARHNIDIYAFTRAIGEIEAQVVDRDEIEKNMVRSPDKNAAVKMIDLVKKMKEDKNSVGGIVELRITGMPVGLGEPVFNKFDAAMSFAIMSLGAVKGVEIGDGFAVSKATGFENNDVYMMNGNKFRTETNHCGGVLGGLTTGEEFVLRAAVKPPASIGIEQDTITKTGEKAKIIVEGRHDPTILPRIIPVVEAMAAIVVLDFMLLQKRIEGFK